MGINSSDGNTVGGQVPAASDTISGNVIGVEIAGIVGTTLADGTHKTVTNVVEGDTIDFNSFGVFINGSQLNLIGGTAAAAADEIARNTEVGVSIVGAQRPAATRWSRGQDRPQRLADLGGRSATSTVGTGVFIRSRR